MLKALPYVVIVLLIAALTYSSFQWGVFHERNSALLETNSALAKSAQHIIDEQAKLQTIEDIITKDTDGTVIKSPVLMRTLKRVSDCSGKTQC